MPRRNPIVEGLKEELRVTKREAENEKALRQRTEGKLEKYEEKEERERDDISRMMRRDEEYRHQLEDQVLWMRRLVEHMCIPIEKLELFEKFRTEITMSADPGFPRRNY